MEGDTTPMVTGDSPGTTSQATTPPEYEVDPAAYVEHVGELIRWLRRRQRLTKPQLAARVTMLCGDPTIDTELLHRWERGRQVPDQYWRRWLASALDIPRQELDRAADRTHNHRPDTRHRRHRPAGGRTT